MKENLHIYNLIKFLSTLSFMNKTSFSDKDVEDFKELLEAFSDFSVSQSELDDVFKVFRHISETVNVY